ncbi:PWWP domain-containing protein 2B [Sarcophilus harrisii]|uniref:PWWP domain-containing protein 2B n=1 Tax=Sarcophilus harrisii TaxID=9305 RepID=UPI001301D8BD|nr:PWWP domain-containing protein 2B [Sarcophilus harrisii]
MEPGAPELRVGCRLPVRVEQIVNVDTLVVSLSCGERSFTGILLDCTKKSGLLGLPLSLPKRDAPPSDSCSRQDPQEEKGAALPPPPPQEKPPAAADGPEPAPPPVPPLPAGSAPPFPPYFEGAPFPHPLWLRQTYSQWVPQPPPRTIKRTKRRLSRNRDPGRLIMSTIRLAKRAHPPTSWRDSLDESSSDAASPGGCDFLPGDDASVSSSSREERKTVPPLTVRLHAQSVARCATEDGRTVAVGDIVWGKIPGCPWWPARVLDLSLGQKEDGQPSWREARVAWFGSPTTSCLSLSKLSPFSEFFKLRFNRKKKG